MSSSFLKTFPHPHLPFEMPSVRPYDRKWLTLAAKAAATSSARWRLGAVVVRGGSVLSVAANRESNAVLTVTDCPWRASEHAEQAALRRASNAAGATLYVVRLGADGSWRYARPCIRCQERADRAGIERVVWSTVSSGFDGCSADLDDADGAALLVR